jgi:hypothetical protein
MIPAFPGFRARAQQEVLVIDVGIILRAPLPDAIECHRQSRRSWSKDGVIVAGSDYEHEHECEHKYEYEHKYEG